ncbi:pyridoxal-phosphate dependent enzyme [Wenzhouxiangella sp. AB-CW3]|uniref:threonine ammonia-lyase n=1 Tax=Wenzhouxiangella sp. AB-CW3 TaxID=2771012 RepID=UPI00168AB59D|nr:pyridoxal-phosphate dependent enzyme [Wenzhouxiangella sp. AB-CW3]QOC22442.1 pyridoxal-phosphate dependent enzyme [Wenzhouxiangella sp. AB-CW3]
MSETLRLPSWTDIEQAVRRIDGYVHRTPVLSSRYFNRRTGANLFFKCENFQRVGAFKFRGACNAIAALPAETARRGVITHSSGNHGQAVALASRLHGYQAVVVMPDDSARVKVEAVREYGAEVVFCAPGTKSRDDAVQELIDRHDHVFVPPYNHPDIIAGQGTAASELLGEIPDLDVILAPVGGGGLISGTAIAARHLAPDIRVIGAEPRNADDAARSFHSGKLEPASPEQTVADGLRTTLGPLNLAVIRDHVDDILTVSEEAIIREMRTVWERMKIIIEPSCAVPLAALSEHDMGINGLRVGIILTGGNVDLDALPW